MLPLIKESLSERVNDDVWEIVEVIVEPLACRNSCGFQRMLEPPSISTSKPS